MGVADSHSKVRASTRVDYGRLRRIAARPSQRGYFTSQQAQQSGIDRSRLSRLTRRGVVIREAHSCYRFTVGAAPSWRDRLAGQLLATQGIACGRTALALIELLAPPKTFDILVTRNGRNAVSPHHTTRLLASQDVVLADGLRALHPLRAIVDAAGGMSRRSVTKLIESAIVRGIIDPFALAQRARELRNSKRPGAQVVLDVLETLHPELERSRNEWEAALLQAVQRFGLPEPRVEAAVRLNGRRYLPDISWPEHRIALEFDGRDPHMRRATHDNDALRRNDFIEGGWLSFGVTATELRSGAARTLTQVANALAARSDSGTA